MFYAKRGEIPKKRHTQFNKQNGELYFEEHISREGFSGIYSNVYHEKMPTELVSVQDFNVIDISEHIGKHKNRHFFTKDLINWDDFIPFDISTPEEMSSPFVFVIFIAFDTLLKFIPPANNQLIFFFTFFFV